MADNRTVSGARTVNEELQARSIRHAIDLRRLSDSEVRETIAFLRQTTLPRLRYHLTQVLANAGEQARPGGLLTESIEREIREIEGIITDGTRRISTIREESLVRVGNYEIDFQADMLKRSVPLSVQNSFSSVFAFDRPSVQTVARIVNASPILGSPGREWWDRAAASWTAEAQGIVRSGIIEGRTTEEIIDEVIGCRAEPLERSLAAKMQRNVEAQVRTEINHVSTQVREAFYGENDDLVAGVIWVATLDTSTTAICRSLDGKFFETGKGQRPPAHYNALDTGTLISTNRGMVPIEDVRVGDYALTHSGRMRRVYAVMGRPSGGDRCILIRTSSGRVLRATHDHPVLTSSGWLRAGDLKPGNEVFESGRQRKHAEPSASAQVEQSVLLDAHNRPSEIVESRIPYLVASSSAGVSASVELDRYLLRDESEIDNACSDPVLELAMLAEDREQDSFVNGGVFAKSDRERLNDSSVSLFVRDRIRDEHSLPMALRKRSGGVRALRAPMIFASMTSDAVRHRDRHFLPSADLDRVPSTRAVQAGLPEREFPLDLADRTAVNPVPSVDEIQHDGAIRKVHTWILSTVTSIVESRFDMVWNLAVEDDETYVADGVVVHNCRSTTAPVLKSLKELGIGDDDERGFPNGVRASMNGDVPEKITYYEWLKGQPRDVQVDVLGPRRAELWRAGKIRPEQLLDSFGKPRTLKELEALIGR